jgi:methylthioribose-1-phosphate isomerase
MKYDTIRPVRWQDGTLVLLDQRELPQREVEIVCRNVREVAEAISDMAVRGAPAIGCTAGFGMALAAASLPADREAAKEKLTEARDLLASTRPTAVNLFWALDRAYRAAERALANGGDGDAAAAVEREARAILEEDLQSCHSIGENGAGLIEPESVLMTHCNAGALATAGYGTALGVVRSAFRRGLVTEVIACETRPRQQGARLTCWELAAEGVPVYLIADTAAGHMMRSGRVDGVVVGADRVARNGDVANKIGTYTLAVLAKENSIPFYVAAPLSTIDLGCPTGEQIVIEHRSPAEVTCPGGTRCAPASVEAINPAFDVTPHRYVTGLITEAGVASPVDEATIGALFEDGKQKRSEG